MAPQPAPDEAELRRQWHKHIEDCARVDGARFPMDMVANLNDQLEALAQPELRPETARQILRQVRCLGQRLSQRPSLL